jgi:hypothetical protein
MLNTPRENAFYVIKAEIDGETWQIKDTDWCRTTSKAYWFK